MVVVVVVAAAVVVVRDRNTAPYTLWCLKTGRSPAAVPEATQGACSDLSSTGCGF